jgi:hypothetical protein
VVRMAVNGMPAALKVSAAPEPVDHADGARDNGRRPSGGAALWVACPKRLDSPW